MPAYVYVLAHRTEPWVKIGRALDIKARAGSIGRDTFGMSRSTALECDTEARAARLERVLHRAFHDWRLDAAEIGDRVPANGHTEWFTDSCRARLDEFLRVSGDLFKAEPLAAERFATLVAVELARTATAGVSRPTVSAELRREQTRLEVEAAFAEWHARSTDLLADWERLAEGARRIVLLAPDEPGAHERLLYVRLDAARVEEVAWLLRRLAQWAGFHCPFGHVGLVNGTYCTRDAAGAQAVASVAWPARTGRSRAPIFERVEAAWAALPVPIEGWGMPLCGNDLAELQVRARQVIDVTTRRFDDALALGGVPSRSSRPG